uniref:Putative Rab geranylgeranyl transferase component A n=1 Tax=Trypanosoma congolense (strain IL3000) TaxID=1068625 RepID=G0UTW0_TRYCI|nr:putative Rab geranylgeranyl transferase component A [Trypanosoma congolense IL3000]
MTETHDEDDQGLGDLFAAGDEAEPEYSIETMTVNRHELSLEGTTTAGFTPLLDSFDRSTDEVKASPRPELRPLNVHFRNKRHSLWGHKLWNAARYLVKRIDSGMINVRGKNVLELGAGLGLPSLAAYRNGARCVVVTDYADKDLLEILEMNVKANCTPDMVDADAADFLRQEADRLRATCMALRRQQQEENQDEETDRAHMCENEGDSSITTQCVVQPLIWGNAQHIRDALRYTRGAGFDILFLSDILFNHICNDALADTVVQLLRCNPGAAAYCAFSHHRAHKQVEDLMFFDKCAARGLSYEQIDEEDYPLMFPEDRGPEEIRRPVKVYRLRHRIDGAGVPLGVGQDSYDVVVQGTGMVECFVSAALARSGIRVLQCDAQSEYGGPFKTMNVNQFRNYIQQAPCDSQGGQNLSRTREGTNPDGTGCTDGVTDSVAEEDENAALISVDVMDTLDTRTQHRFLLDLLPTHYFSRGDTAVQLVESDMARYVDFQRCDSFAFLLRSDETTKGDDPPFRLQSVPLTRAQVFSAEHVGLMQKRRLMKFVKDVAAPLAEHLHAHNANTGEDDPARTVEQEISQLFLQEADLHPNETLGDLLYRKYALDRGTIDIITLLGQVEGSRKPDMLRAVDLVRQVLTSMGAYGGLTPFLFPLYGAAEVPQNMCRIAAVFNALFILRRSVSCIPRGTDVPVVEMSNRQRVKAKVIILPRTLVNVVTSGTTTTADNSDSTGAVCFSRVILVARKPLITWEALRSSGCSEGKSSTIITGAAKSAEESEVEEIPPLVAALCQVKPGVVVHIQQHSAASEQAPNNGTDVVVHFTVDNSHMTARALHQFVEQSFINSSPPSEVSVIAGGVGVERDALLFFASFIVDEREEALRSIVSSAKVGGISETTKAHPFAVEEFRKRQRLRDTDAGEEDDGCAIVAVPTLLHELMDSGAYLKAARQAYEAVVSKLRPRKEEAGEPKDYTFLERLPPVCSIGS